MSPVSRSKNYILRRQVPPELQAQGLAAFTSGASNAEVAAIMQMNYAAYRDWRSYHPDGQSWPCRQGAGGGPPVGLRRGESEPRYTLADKQEHRARRDEIWRGWSESERLERRVRAPDQLANPLRSHRHPGR